MRGWIKRSRSMLDDERLQAACKGEAPAEAALVVLAWEELLAARYEAREPLSRFEFERTIVFRLARLRVDADRVHIVVGRFVSCGLLVPQGSKLEVTSWDKWYPPEGRAARRCAHCDTVLRGTSRKRYCSSRCRLHAHRQDAPQAALKLAGTARKRRPAAAAKTQRASARAVEPASKAVQRGVYETERTVYETQRETQRRSVSARCVAPSASEKRCNPFTKRDLQPFSACPESGNRETQRGVYETERETQRTPVCVSSDAVSSNAERVYERETQTRALSCTLVHLPMHVQVPLRTKLCIESTPGTRTPEGSNPPPAATARCIGSKEQVGDDRRAPPKHSYDEADRAWKRAVARVERRSADEWDDECHQDSSKPRSIGDLLSGLLEGNGVAVSPRESKLRAILRESRVFEGSSFELHCARLEADGLGYEHARTLLWWAMRRGRDPVRLLGHWLSKPGVWRPAYDEATCALNRRRLKGAI